MNAKLSRGLIGYGLFVLIMGGIGYATNPDKAISALISGSVACLLSIAWALMVRAGKSWAIPAAMVTMLVFSVAFSVRAVKAWQAYAGGAKEKLLAASLISAMTLASLWMLGCLIKNRKSISAA